MIIERDAAGRALRARVASASRPGVVYELSASASGRWQHLHADCAGWNERGGCRHVAELEDRMADESEETTKAITVQMNPLALLDAVELDQVLGSKLTASPRHVYAFNVKGQHVEGVSIDGVRDAARALSTKGEAIRELWVRLEREDDRNAYFVACAARYAVAPDGREICMDTAIRAKRQPKWGRVKDPKPGEPAEYFIEFWYEIGVAKAVRNATEALLPEALKDWIKANARAATASAASPARPASALRGRRDVHAPSPDAGEAAHPNWAAFTRALRELDISDHPAVEEYAPISARAEMGAADMWAALEAIKIAAGIDPTVQA